MEFYTGTKKAWGRSRGTAPRPQEPGSVESRVLGKAPVGHKKRGAKNGLACALTRSGRAAHLTGIAGMAVLEGGAGPRLPGTSRKCSRCLGQGFAD